MRVGAALFSLALVAPVALPAQTAGSGVDSTTQRSTAAQGRPAVRDSLKPPLGPGRAFLYSFALPGLAQARLHRQTAGALYFSLEATSIAMLVKSSNELRIAREHQGDAVVSKYQVDPTTGAPVVDTAGRFVPADSAGNRYTADRVKARKTQVEDWIATLIFNHLFSGADAFVSSQLWDLPARVGIRLMPRGAIVGVSIGR